MADKNWENLSPEKKAEWLDKNFDESMSQKTKKELMWRKWRYKGIPRHKRRRWWNH